MAYGGLWRPHATKLDPGGKPTTTRKDTRYPNGPRNRRLYLQIDSLVTMRVRYRASGASALQDNYPPYSMLYLELKQIWQEVYPLHDQENGQSNRG